MNCLVCISLLALLLVGQVESAGEEPSKSWLATHFQVDPSQVEEVEAPKQPFPDKDEPVDQLLLNRRQKMVLNYTVGLYEELLENGQILAEDIVVQIKETKNKNLASMLSDVRLDMHRAAKRLNQYPRALLEALKLRDVCEYLNGCDVSIANALLVETEKKFNSLDNYEKLGLTQGATKSEVKSAYRKLMILVHPDRHFDLDDKSRKYLEELFIQLRVALEAIIRPSSDPSGQKERKLIGADYLKNKQQ